MDKIMLKPVDWLALDLKKTCTKSTEADILHSLFTDRVKFENFTASYLDEIENKIKKYLNLNNNLLLVLDLVTLLVQNKTTTLRLQEAQKLLSDINKIELNEELHLTYNELNETINNFLQEKIEKRIRLVNWGIYNRCPLVCKGCYNIFNKNILTIKECKSIVNKIVQAGVEMILISGGDPLLWKHIVEFCDYAKNKGLKVIIDTVGYNLDEKLIKSLSKLLYHIGIPLDGSNQKVITGFRLGKKDLCQVIGNTIKKLDEFDLKVRINTTVSKANVNDLENMAHLINQYNNIKGWGLYQWWPIRASSRLISEMSINEDELLEKIPILSEIVNIPIYPRTIKKRARDTFFISSNGEVYAFDEAKSLHTLIIGDIKTQSVNEILKSPALKTDSHKWKSII